MNVVLIVADTWRRDHVGCYGNRWIRTPNVDRLAGMGAVFDNCRFGSYPTLPCRNDILTGRYEFPWRGWGGPDRDAVTLSGLIDRAGKISYFLTDIYHHWRRAGGTYWWDFSGFELIRGQERDRWITDADIDVKYPAPEYEEDKNRIGPHLRNAQFLRKDESDWSAPRLFERACRWIRHNAAHDDFFLMVDAFDPHEPWDPPRYYTDLYDDPAYDGHEYVSPAYGPIEGYLTPAEFKHIQAMYAGEITMVDRYVGRLIRQIEAVGLMDKTLIVVTTDHGTYNGDHGLVGKNRTLYEGLAHIPLIVWHPEFAHGKRLDQLVQQIDFLPTVLEAVGVEAPEGIHGRSILPLLRAADAGEDPPWRRAALFGNYRDWCNVTDGRWVLHRKFDGSETLLFDLQSDPCEERNLAEESPDRLVHMKGLLREKLKEIDAPADLVAGACS